MLLSQPRRALFRALAFLFFLLTLISALPTAAKSRPATPLDPDYVAALAAANHFLQAWQMGDIESGTVLMTGRVKESVDRDNLDRFFSNPEASAYEINRGTLVKRGRYEFPVVLVTSAAKSPWVRRRFSSIVIVNTGKNEWAVDKLP